MPEAVTLYCKTLPTGHVLTVRHGDLTEERADAIVNAANSGLVHGGGVAGAILRKGGQVIQDESDRVGRVAIGSAAVTGAGALPARFVIHAVGPVWRANTEEQNDRLLASATVAALEIAREKGLDSVAFPAVSSGIFGFPKDRCARVMLKAVTDWAAGHPDDGPRDLRFVLVDDLTLSCFLTEAERRFGPSEAD
jgi:O-acetyl-ADP-ribose deacetylase (regulator of RNase III)